MLLMAADTAFRVDLVSLRGPPRPTTPSHATPRHATPRYDLITLYGAAAWKPLTSLDANIRRRDASRRPPSGSVSRSDGQWVSQLDLCKCGMLISREENCYRSRFEQLQNNGKIFIEI
jgi:hypothetical protein